MPMNVQAIASLPDKINQIRLLTAKDRQQRDPPQREQACGAIARDGTVLRQGEGGVPRNLRKESIQDKVKQAGLWAPHLPEEYGGCGLTFLEHAYMNEVLAYAIGSGRFVWRRRPQLGQPEDPC